MRVWHRPRWDHADVGCPRAPPHGAPAAEPRRTSPGGGGPGRAVRQAHGGGQSRTGRPPGPQEAPQELGVLGGTAGVQLIRILGIGHTVPALTRGIGGHPKPLSVEQGFRPAPNACQPWPWARGSSGHPAHLPHLEDFHSHVRTQPTETWDPAPPRPPHLCSGPGRVCSKACSRLSEHPAHGPVVAIAPASPVSLGPEHSGGFQGSP